MTGQRGLVSVMMPMYNAAAFAAESVASLRAQTYAAWELIAVDDGSTDGSADVLEAMDDPRIRVVRQAHAGEAAARDAALAAARGEFVAFLDADDLFLPHHLELTVGYLDRHRAVGGVYTDGYYYFEGQRLRTLSSRRLGWFDGLVLDQVVRSSAMFGPPLAVVLRTEAIVDAGARFDRRITIGPDWDFFAQLAGTVTFGYVDDVTCLYRLHQHSISARTGDDRRRRDLALCRRNAIARPSFSRCTPDTQEFVFHDLLVSLLHGQPAEQDCVVRGAAFGRLAPVRRARLLRLMAARAIVDGLAAHHVSAWLEEGRRLDPSDRRGRVLRALHTWSPHLCRAVLRVRTARERARAVAPPMSDIALPSPESAHADRAVP